MKKRRIVSIDSFHNERVIDEIAELKNRGYNITKVEKIQRMFFFMGKNITDIYYERATRHYS